MSSFQTDRDVNEVLVEKSIQAGRIGKMFIVDPSVKFGSKVANTIIQPEKSAKKPKIDYKRYSQEARRLLDTRAQRKPDRIYNEGQRFNVKAGYDGGAKGYVQEIRRASYTGALNKKQLIGAQKVNIKLAGEKLDAYTSKCKAKDAVEGKIRKLNDIIASNVLDLTGEATDVHGRKESIKPEVNAVKHTARTTTDLGKWIYRQNKKFELGKGRRLERRELRHLKSELRKEKRDLKKVRKIRDRNRLAALTNPADRKKFQKRQIKKRFARLRYTARMDFRLVKSSLKEAPRNLLKAILRLIRRVAKAAARVALKVVFSSLGVFLILFVCIVAILFLMLGGGETSIVADTYQASGEEMLRAEKDYSDLEEKLQEESREENVKKKYPGYDDYLITVPEFTHDPYSLQSYLNVKFGAYRASSVASSIESMFNAAYTIVVEEETYQENQKTKRRLKYTVKKRDLDSIALERFGDGTAEAQLYARYQGGHGQYPELFNANGQSFDDMYAYTYKGGKIDSSSPQYASISQAAHSTRVGSALYETGIQFLGTEYVWGGASPSTGFDCSGFLSYTINHSGVARIAGGGRTTANGLYKNYSTPVPPSAALPGDLIFFQGTYATTGASHCGIYLGNGYMIHCGHPVKISPINTPYWQKHFLSFGRLKTS